MYEQEIIDCCRRLKLSRALADRAILEGGEKEKKYLYNILVQELANRESSRRNMLANTAGFYTRKDIENFIQDDVDFRFEGGLERLETLDFVKEKKNIVMYGNQGTGKTFLSIALGMECCKAGIPVKFYRTASLVKRFVPSKA